MIILKSIGNFFVRIWRWIKETAWVQPLLIVGAIFAIVFSIPYMTNWINSLTGNAEGAYYSSKKVTLNGEQSMNGDVTDADKLTNSIYHNTVEVFYEGNSEFDLAGYAEKFYLVFIDSSSGDMATSESAFRYLQDNWGKYLKPSDGLSFNLYVIDKAEVSDNDKDYENIDGSTAFERYIINHADLFNEVGPNLAKTPYKERASIDESNYQNFSVENSTSTFPTPSICLVDYTQAAVEAGRAGLSEVLFTLTGSTESERASLLMDMWNHTDAYSTDNLFTQQD